MLTLRLPPAKYRLDLVFPPDTDPRTGKRRAGFETVGQCQAEDEGRALGLTATADAISALSAGTNATAANSELTGLNIDPRVATNLANRLQAGAESRRPQPTLASALFMHERQSYWGYRPKACLAFSPMV